MKIFNCAILSLLILSACGGDNSGEDQKKKLGKAKGDVHYGGVFKVNEIENFTTLFPQNITDIYSHHITSQVYQSLLKFDQETLETKPSLAESFDVNDDATEYVFHLRKGINFHDDPCFKDGKGRELTANDVKYSLDFACSADPMNKMFYLFDGKVKGAKEHFEATQNGKKSEGGVSGIEVVDDYTLKIKLIRPYSIFDKIVAHYGASVFPREAFEKYGRDMRTNCVGTGPFMIKTVKEGDVVYLDRNPNYWEVDEYGNQLPYLEGIKVSFIKEKKTELMEFKKGNLDMVWKLPVEEIPNLLENLDQAKDGKNVEFKSQSIDALSIQYYAFLNTHPIFSKKKVRQAFNYAIDRESLTNNTLQGEGTPAYHGFVPPMPGFPIDQVQGFDYNVDKARQLMSEAGYPNGNGFPEVTLQLNSGGTTNELLAQAIQSMLKENIGVSIKLDILPMSQHQNKFESGQSAFWRIGWVADYPDPEVFLNMFYGLNVPDDPSKPTYINAYRYKNSEFDALFEQALRERDVEKRMALYAKADQIVVDDAVVMPIFYDNYFRVVNPLVVNFPINAMELRDFTRVYFTPEEK